jgi:hypothetical protein
MGLDGVSRMRGVGGKGASEEMLPRERRCAELDWAVGCGRGFGRVWGVYVVHGGCDLHDFGTAVNIASVGSGTSDLCSMPLDRHEAATHDLVHAHCRARTGIVTDTSQSPP